MANKTGQEIQVVQPDLRVHLNLTLLQVEILRQGGVKFEFYASEALRDAAWETKVSEGPIVPGHLATRGPFDSFRNESNLSVRARLRSVYF
eukprot:3939351-Rhodomonas_salina.1